MHLFYIIITYISEVIFYFLPLSSYLSVTRITQKVVDEFHDFLEELVCDWQLIGLLLTKKQKLRHPALAPHWREYVRVLRNSLQCREGAFSTVMGVVIISGTERRNGTTASRSGFYKNLIIYGTEQRNAL